MNVAKCQCGAPVDFEVVHFGRVIDGRYYPDGSTVELPHTCRPRDEIPARAEGCIWCGGKVPAPKGKNTVRATCSPQCQRDHARESNRRWLAQKAAGLDV